MMKTVLGYSGNGQAGDKERGHDIVSMTSLDPEWQKTSGAIAVSGTTPIHFIWEIPDCMPPSFELVSGGVAKVLVQLYACFDRLAKNGADQDESQDIRAAHWVEVTAQYLASGAAGAFAAPSASAAAIASKLYYPSEPFVRGMRAPWMKIVITPDGTVASPDAFDMYTHATDK